MDSQTLHAKYFKAGTGGFAVMARFYEKYSDVLALIQYADINDLINKVFLSLTRTDFQKIDNEEHYIMRAIKLHCWSLLDKAIRQKGVVVATPPDVEQENSAVDARVSGDHSGGVTPDPIPNSAVKPSSADGTARANVR